MAARASVTASFNAAKAWGWPWPVRIAVSRLAAASATAKAPIPRAEPFELVGECAGLGRQCCHRRNQANRLLGEHREHFLFQLGVAERHAREVIEVERAVDGCKRGRRHPVHPLQFRRHGAGPGIARCPPIRRSSSPHRSMEMVNEVFGPFYANPPVY